MLDTPTVHWYYYITEQQSWMGYIACMYRNTLCSFKYSAIHVFLGSLFDIPIIDSFFVLVLLDAQKAGTVPKQSKNMTFIKITN